MPEFEHQGIAHQLVKQSIESVQSKCDIILSICWNKSGVAPFGKILEAFNFEVIKVFNEYWKQDSIDKKYLCAICGTPPCLCDATLYALNIVG